MTVPWQSTSFGPQAHEVGSQARVQVRSISGCLCTGTNTRGSSDLASCLLRVRPPVRLHYLATGPCLEAHLSNLRPWRKDERPPRRPASRLQSPGPAPATPSAHSGPHRCPPLPPPPPDNRSGFGGTNRRAATQGRPCAPRSGVPSHCGDQ